MKKFFGNKGPNISKLKRKMEVPSSFIELQMAKRVLNTKLIIDGNVVTNFEKIASKLLISMKDYLLVRHHFALELKIFLMLGSWMKRFSPSKAHFPRKKLRLQFSI